MRKYQPSGSLLLVEWFDAFGSGGWQRAEDIRADDGQATIQTVGWVVADKEDYLVLTMQTQLGTSCVGATASIPQACIQRVVRLGSKYRSTGLDE